MATQVNYYLKKAEQSTGLSLIYLQFKYSGNKLVFSFGQSIDPKNWNANKQRVKSNKQTTADGDHSLNDLLDTLKEVCEKAYKHELRNGTPLPETIKKHLKAFLNRNHDTVKNVPTKPTLYGLLDRFISGDIKKKGGREKSRNTLDNYNSVKRHLKSFEEKKNYRIDFDTITLDFYESYTTYLRKTLQLQHNTIAKDITLLKSVLNKAVSLGHTGNLSHKHQDFGYSEEPTDAVYLKEYEIVKLFNFKAASQKLENVKDLFVFGCLVGLRFSDYNNLRPENIIEEDGDLYIKIKTQKTDEIVFIPCHPVVLQIFEKYNQSTNRLPRSISGQKFNEYIKTVCKAAGFDQVGRLTTEPEKPLYECITSHTARRSFCTNLFLEGFPVIEIMKISGHKTEKAFMKYIRVSKLDTAKRLNTHMKDMWKKKLYAVNQLTTLDHAVNE